MIASTVRPIHFEDYSGKAFERLVFAYHVRDGWSDLEWYGQTGSDMGRDIVGIAPSGKRGRKTVVQCVNRTALTLAKAKHDMKSAAQATALQPIKYFKFVCRSDVSAGMRTKIRAQGKALGFRGIDVWSGSEFEEHLRLRAETLLQRFEKGEPFPDTPTALISFADEFPGLSDEDALQMLAPVFHRPAFDTYIQEESSLPDFLQAIEDTIRALNTGLWRDREGNSIRRLPSIHTIKNAAIRAELSRVCHDIDEVRKTFKRGINNGSIRHCDCGKASCPVFMISPETASALESSRLSALERFRALLA